MMHNQTLFNPTAEAPVSIQIYNGDCEFNQSHPQTELFFVISGETDVLIEDQRYHLHAEDILLVNGYDKHYFHVTDCCFFSVSFDLSNISGINPEQLPYFDVNSSGNTANTKYDYIRYLCAQMLKANYSAENHIQTLSLLYALIDHLLECFLSVSYKAKRIGSNVNMFYSISDHIKAHYAENLSLNTLAMQFNISVPYLSSCFKKYMDTTFLAFYNDIRLSHAVNEMLTSENTLEEIALKNGFPNSRVFVSLFRKKYHELPSAYRKKHKLNTLADIYQKNATSSEFPVELNTLTKYLNLNKDSHQLMIYPKERSVNIEAGTVDVQPPGVPLKHHYKTFCCVGSARQFLYADIQEMLRLVQKEIGYKYVKFHGILSDEMMVYTEDGHGTPHYSFVLVDKVLDFILSIGLKPLIQLSFMPRQLASDPDKMIDMDHFNTSPPKDMEKWIDLVTHFMKHLVKRYGLETIRKWLYCVWNEPDGPANAFGWNQPKLFYKFYQVTYETVKAIDEQLVFGSPSLLFSPDAINTWQEEFFAHCDKYSCKPDFINVHYYDNSFFSQVEENKDSKIHRAFQLENTATVCPLSEDPFAFTKFINGLKAHLKQLHMKNVPVYLTEWNLTVSHRDPINDTCFKACYLVKNLLLNYDRLDSYGYWCLTDFHEELQLSEDLYHGGLGMFTYNGIPKSHYNGFKFLTYLEDNMIATGNGYFITKGNHKISIIVYNYEHYSKLLSDTSFSNNNSDDRYASFIQMQDGNFSLTLENIPSQGCLIKEMFISQQNGSSYDTWMRMGAQPLNHTSDLELLSQRAQPIVYMHRQDITDGNLTVESTLKPLEVRLILVELDIN